MSCRRLLLQGQLLLRRAAGNGMDSLQRPAYSTLPEDLQAALSRARYPVRRPQPSAAEVAADGAPSVSPAAAAAAGQAAATKVAAGE